MQCTKLCPIILGDVCEAFVKFQIICRIFVREKFLLTEVVDETVDALVKGLVSIIEFECVFEIFKLLHWWVAIID